MKVDYLLNTYALPLFENALTPENNNKMLMISLSQRPSKSGVLFWGKARKSVKREEGPPDHRLLCYVRIDIGAFLIFKNCYYWGRQEEPAILISRLFLPMRRDSHVRSQHLFGLPLRMNVMHGTQFHHARIDHLSRKTYADHSNGAKAF